MAMPAAHLIRVLRSTQVALPMTSDFWGDLARGLVTSPENLASDIARLYDGGMIEGMWGEPNPALPGSFEYLVEDAAGADGGRVRWTASNGDYRSVWTLSRRSAGWQSVRWFKASVLPDWSAEGAGDLLSRSSDRTTMVRPDEMEKPQPMTLEQKRVFEALSGPVRIVPPETPWRWLAGATGMEPEECRKAVAGLVIARHWRRFAFRINLGNCGWKGCRLVGWEIEESQVPGAAQALASIRGTGDVCLRVGPMQLTAVLMAREPEVSAEVLRRISEQWQREAVLEKGL